MTEKEWIDLGDNHSYRFTQYEGDMHAGVNVKHLTPEGKECTGFCSIAGGKWAKEFDFNPNHQAWDMASSEPLTLSPSVLCLVCKDHGFIQNGKWVRA